MNAQKNNQIEMPFSIDCLRNKNNLKDETVVEEYVKLDSILIENIFNKVPSYSSNLDSLKTLIPDLLIGDDNVSLDILNLGNELKLIKYSIYGGYETIELEILHFGNKILRVNQYISSYRELIEARYLTLIKVPLTCKYGEVENVTIHMENIKDYKIHFPNIHLDILANYSNQKDNEAFDFFNDYSNSRNLIIQSMHVYSSYWDPAINHIKYLVENNKYEILEEIINSPMPTGRLFAVSALNYLILNKNYKPSRKISSRINEIRTEGTIIRSGILSCHIGKFDYDYIDVFNDFEDIVFEK
jgi:hypothetical protein